ncbi:MAG TPA: hypothetical protein VLC71_09645 [Thermomonas sp.]|nr:hypothetical protein [Thermomonas sp.]
MVFLYVLALPGPEDLLKVGISRHPLVRWESFHRRWFRAFDLDCSMLVETDTRAEAQAMETRLHRSLMGHQCPIPLTIRLNAGGFTEWYRGVSSLAEEFVHAREQEGYVVHMRARHWLVPQMREVGEGLHAVAAFAYEQHLAGRLQHDELDRLRALVEGQKAFDADIETMIPAEIRGALGLDQ